MESINVLIIEDDVKIAEIQCIFTEKINGFSVTGIAHSISEAEEMISVLQPDLILLDIFFPDGNGIDLLWKIRTDHKETDVILITAAKEVDYFQEALRGGVFDYVLKPLVFSRFEDTLIRFRKHRTKLQKISTINQQEVDRLLRKKGNDVLSKNNMPKGIDPITLKKIIKIMQETGTVGISAEKAGEKIGVSRTTSRRYLEYLVAGGVITADLYYGTPGRPERIYLLKKSNDKKADT